MLIGERPLGEDADAVITDSETGYDYFFSLVASEWDAGEDGVGQLTMLLEGPSLGLCSARGSGVEIDWQIGSPPFDPYSYDYGGNQPLLDVGCGTAYGMSVEIDGCKGEIQYHGYVHSDHPNIVYMGMMTLDLKIEQSDSGWEADIEVYTPKDDIKISELCQLCCVL
jgi:hypothetical protein